MTSPVYLWLAAGALGAPGDAPCTSCGAAASRPAATYVQAQSSGGARDWLRNLFGPRQASATTMAQRQVGRPVTYTTAEPPLAIQPAQYAAQPAGATTQAKYVPAQEPAQYMSSPHVKIVNPRATYVRQPAIRYQPAPSYQPVPHATMATPAPGAEQAKLVVAKKYEDRVGHEKDYSWVTGHLFYVHADGGRWVVRYGLPDEVDKFGGSIILAPGVEMRNYREGDLVCVHGDILSHDRTSSSLGGALYRVNVISLVDRSDP